MQRVLQQQHSYGWLQRSYYFEPISLTETEVPIMLAILLIVTVLEWWFFWQKGHVTIIPFLKRILACFGLNPSRHYLGPMKRIAHPRTYLSSVYYLDIINLALIFLLKSLSSKTYLLYSSRRYTKLYVDFSVHHKLSSRYFFSPSQTQLSHVKFNHETINNSALPCSDDREVVWVTTTTVTILLLSPFSPFDNLIFI